MRLDRAAVDGDPAVSGRLQTNADDIHIEAAVQRKARVVMRAVAAPGVDAAHAGVGKISAAAGALRRRCIVGNVHLQLAAHGERAAVREGESRHVVVLNGACDTLARDINEDIPRPDRIVAFSECLSDCRTRCMLPNFFVPASSVCGRGLRPRAGIDVGALSVRLVGDISDLEGSRGRRQSLGDLHLPREIPLSVGVAQIAQFIRKGVEGIVDLTLLRCIRGGGVQPCLVRCERDKRAGRRILHDEVAAEDAAVRAASVEDALISAVMIDGDRLVLTLEDIAARRLRCAADEAPNLAALIEIAVLVRSFLLGRRTLRPEPAILPRSTVREIEIDAGVLWIRAVFRKLVQYAADELRVRCGQPERDERYIRIGAWCRIRAVVLVQHAEVAVDIHICRPRCIAVRTGVHEHLAPILGEHGVRLGGLHNARADRAALQRDLGVLVGLERHADDIHICQTVQGELGRAVCSAAESRIDAAHIVVGGIRSGGGRLSLNGGHLVPQDEAEVAVDRHLRAGFQRYAGDLILPSAAAAKNIDIEILVVEFVLIVLQRDADRRSARLVDRDVRCGYRPCAAEEVQGKSR